MGKETSRHGELAARHRDGAMMEIDAKYEVHRILENAKGFHVIGQSAVAKSGSLFRRGHSLIDRNRGIACQKPHESEDFAKCLARVMVGEDQISDHNRAGIDEGVTRYAALIFQLNDGV